jgi:hypothetical protein
MTENTAENKCTSMLNTVSKMFHLTQKKNICKHWNVTMLSCESKHSMLQRKLTLDMKNQIQTGYPRIPLYYCTEHVQNMAPERGWQKMAIKYHHHVNIYLSY